MSSWRETVGRMTHRRYGRAAPTHHELLAVENRLAIARKGERVLERRRDGLVFALLDLLERRRELRARTDEAFLRANRLHALGAEREGEIALRALSEARPTRPELLLDETKLFGLAVPVFLNRNLSTRVEDRGYGVVGTSALDDELVAAADPARLDGDPDLAGVRFRHVALHEFELGSGLRHDRGTHGVRHRNTLRSRRSRS